MGSAFSVVASLSMDARHGGRSAVVLAAPSRNAYEAVMTESRARLFTRWFLALAYAFAGYKHLTAPSGFVAITPGWVPDPRGVVLATGWCEIAGTIGLLVPPSLLRGPRCAAGIGLALYALCVWPANINQALHDIPIGGVHLSWWYHGPRLALQPVIIWAALWAGGVTDWPWGQKGMGIPES